ncbi:MAG: hypothetical protein R3C52_07040 [Hyphomonadaceae bacterium]
MPEISILHALSAMFAGGAAASGWTVAVIVANSAFEGLDAGRADRTLRRMLVASATFQASLLGVAAALAVIKGANGAAIMSVVAALGFLSNIWTLAPRREKALPGARKRLKTGRMVAVALTLMVTLVAAIGAILAAFGI